MFRSLYSKLAAVLTGLFLVVGISYIALTLFSTEMYQQEVNQKLNSKLAQQIVAEKLLMKDKRVNQEALEELFHILMVINPSIEIYLLNPEGVILAYSAPKGKVKLKRVDLGPVRKWLEGNMTRPLLGDNPRDPSRQKVFTAAPIVEGGNLEGYLYIILGGEIYDTIVQKLKGSYILQLSTWMIAATLLFALIAGLIFFAVLTGRLRKLADIMDAYKKGGTEKKIDLSLKKAEHFVDEIDRLGATFKEMTERIDDQMEQLRLSDSLRRELVANVSHDLRTPLATLQGYIETMLMKENLLTREERRCYLDVAIRHCKRLSKLVSELLELAKLDSYEAGLKCEPFNLSELVHDVVQKFKLRAEDKHLQIDITIPETLPFVHGDIGLIERVLENLIDNAVYYTPQGGSILLVLEPRGDKLLVKVSDTGCGIPENELPRIFDRFYQLEKSRSTEDGHSGLGLAIAKKILELHKESIDVSSSPGSGTSFTFQLLLINPA